MWSIILGFAKKVGFRGLVIAGTAAALFAAGWITNGWRYQAKIESQNATNAENYAKRLEQYSQKYREQLETDQAAIEALSGDLEQLRRQRRELEEELRTARVVKPYDEICESGGNPFAPDFVRLWNDSATAD